MYFMEHTLRHSTDRKIGTLPKYSQQLFRNYIEVITQFAFLSHNQYLLFSAVNTWCNLTRHLTRNITVISVRSDAVYITCFGINHKQTNLQTTVQYFRY